MWTLLQDRICPPRRLLRLEPRRRQVHLDPVAHQPRRLQHHSISHHGAVSHQRGSHAGGGADQRDRRDGTRPATSTRWGDCSRPRRRARRSSPFSSFFLLLFFPASAASPRAGLWWHVGPRRACSGRPPGGAPPTRSMRTARRRLRRARVSYTSSGENHLLLSIYCIVR